MPDKPQTCPDCRRKTTDCYVPVDPETWPQAAVDAYRLANLSTAASCPAGQAKDMYRTLHGRRPGWCLDRIVRHPEYSGEAVPGLERDVQGRRLMQAKRRASP